ncbi:MAG: manganese efflux pump MntP family protein [Longicatena sp.]
MDILSVLFLGIGLSMDAFAVSIAKGMTIKKEELLKYALYLGFFFGLFQGMMPLLGYWIGSYFKSFISSIDHWIAFGLLGIIGINMIQEALHPKEDNKEEQLGLKTILVLAIATSIDALAIGISFAFLQVDIILAVLIIGITTFILSFIAVIIGNKLGGLLEKYAGILGGCILLLLGCKILIEHLFFS